MSETFNSDASRTSSSKPASINSRPEPICAKQSSRLARNFRKIVSAACASMDFMPRLAFASLTLLVGLAVGYILRSPENKDAQITEMGQEIHDLKEMMMLSLLEKESATDRLKAVSLTDQMDQASKQVTSALLQTLNNDENVSVRLAALDALRPYSKDSQIREALVRSIAQQKSPLVQVALAELMADLQEKGAIDAFKGILEDGETPSDIKKKIRENIQEI